MANTPLWENSSGSVMGDADRTEFHFNEELSPYELLELFERNPRMGMLEWINDAITTNGIKFKDDAEVDLSDFSDKKEVDDDDDMEIDDEDKPEPLKQSEYLDEIHHWEKQNALMNYCSLLGWGGAVLLGKDKDLSKPEKRYIDYMPCHISDGSGSGLMIDTVWQNEPDVPTNKVGQPKTYKLFIRSEKLVTPAVFPVTAERVIMWKNPKKRMRWDGTPDSKRMDHVALLEELLIKCLGKRGLDLAGHCTLFGNVRDAGHAETIKSVWNHGLISEFFHKNLTIEPYDAKLLGSGNEYTAIFDILKSYISAGLQVDKEAMESSSDRGGKGLIVNMAKVKQRQCHFKPYMLELFKKLGFKKPQFEWNEAITAPMNPNLPVQNRGEMDGAGNRDQEISKPPTGKVQVK